MPSTESIDFSPPVHLLDPRDRHWRARQQAPTSLIELCRQRHQDEDAAPLLVDLIFDLRFVALRTEDQLIYGAYRDFLIDLGTVMQDLPWSIQAGRRAERLLPRLSPTGGAAFLRSGARILAPLIRCLNKESLRSIASGHGSASARLAAIRALAMTRDASQATFVAERCSQDPDLNVRQQAEPLRVFLLSESVGELPDTVLPANTSRSTPIDDRERDKLIAQLGEPSHSQCTTDFELGKAYGAREQAARKLAHAPLDESHKQALMVVARDPYVYARLAAVETLASSFAADQDVRDFLMERSAVDTEWDSGDDVGEEIRGAILIALARGRSGDEKVYSWILERSETDPGADVRCDALEALAVGWPDSPETIERLIRLAETAEISERCRAIKILARSRRQDPGATYSVPQQRITAFHRFGPWLGIGAAGRYPRFGHDP